MKILDLFSGLEGWSSAFRARGHETVTIDLDYTFNPTYCRNIANIDDLRQFGDFDVILASPPCENFSVGSLYVHWKDGKPKDAETERSIALVKHTLGLIEKANPKFWVMENPRGMLRNIIGKPAVEVAYCQYGLKTMKPTDLWGRLPPSFTPMTCKNGDPDHVAAPRSSKRGTQAIYDKERGGRHAATRALIPYDLSLAICEACERDMDVK